ncbi:hypothetical protein DAPPUDRAFT_102075 [Daphnia pulex]|uniref:Uncharacterized protein n=1 Tax=Daphnia pulex TaxID=6669 RepID=E9GFA6_DAPPU|nr:hypothetical protein DAPPUDRAFT_102075 [Daphnia pulex]|eukprot:EFX81844.1 hypothetical protein DAPPUDRAFT_102075 [Daphnia pulex]
MGHLRKVNVYRAFGFQRGNGASNGGQCAVLAMLLNIYTLFTRIVSCDARLHLSNYSNQDREAGLNQRNDSHQQLMPEKMGEWDGEKEAEARGEELAPFNSVNKDNLPDDLNLYSTTLFSSLMKNPLV